MPIINVALLYSHDSGCLGLDQNCTVSDMKQC